MPTLRVLGCDGSYPGPGGAASGYLVRAGVTTVWLDAGSGTLANLQRHCVLEDVDAIILSHEHPDHWSDLEGFAVAARYAFRRPPVPVFAPPGLRDRSAHAHDEVLEWHEVQPSHRIVIGELLASFVATDHGPPTLAVRFDFRASRDPARALAYSADTGPEWSAAELGQGIGTLLCEATYTAQFEGRLRHLSGRQAGVMAAQAGAGRLLLTHRWPTVSPEALRAEAEAAFGGPVEQVAMDEIYEW
jgi:ribonuclease BN (tRNA processing enzyme)